MIANNKNNKQISMNKNNKLKGINNAALILVISLCNFYYVNCYTATALFGGMNSKCSEPHHQRLMDAMKKGLDQKQIDCFETTLYVGIKFQAELICEKLRSNDYYRNAFDINLVGLSQGGLIARYILEECDISPQTRFRNLLTLGTPHNGISVIPAAACKSLDVAMRYICSMANGVLANLAFTDLMQSTIGPAGYIRNTNNLQYYKDKSKFLASLNNENNKGSEAYRKHKERMESLNSFMMVLFEKDEIVFPIASEFFGEQSAGESNRKEVSMQETDTYKNNDLGLKTLDEK